MVAISSKAANSELTVFGHVAFCLAHFLCIAKEDIFFANDQDTFSSFSERFENLFFNACYTHEYQTLTLRFKQQQTMSRWDRLRSDASKFVENPQKKQKKT